MAKSNRKLIDLTGQIFGRLTVIIEVERLVTDKSRRRWLCQCECGKTKIIGHCHLVRSIRSCGCLQREALLRRITKHGGCDKPEYGVWAGMIKRCTNPNEVRYKDYGLRGITICGRWRSSFEAFYADMGPRPTPKHSIDRINNDGGYWCGRCTECLKNEQPANCKWATELEQAANTRRNHMLTANGETLHIAEWARRLETSEGTILNRLKLHSVEYAVTAPVRRFKTIQHPKLSRL